MENRNARFWVLINCSPVKITLRPDGELEYYRRWSHDEGWSSEYRRWRHEGACVVEESATDGTDCDGRLSTSNSYHAPLEALAARAPYLEYLDRFERAAWDGVSWPDWQRGESCQRDYSAESAGY